MMEPLKSLKEVGVLNSKKQPNSYFNRSRRKERLVETVYNKPNTSTNNKSLWI